MQKPETWDNTATAYDPVSVSMTAPFIVDSFGHLPPRAERVLDVATGTGLFPLKYIDMFPHVKEILATDFSPKMIELCNKRIPANSVIKTAVQDAQVNHC